MPDSVPHTDIVRKVLQKPTQGQKLLQQRLLVMNQIPFLTDGLIASHIQLLPEDPVPPPLDGKLIRKANPGNVMLSEPYREGHVVYFNIFKETDEINIDHPSDHFVGLPILEATRQIGMAISHIVADIHIDTRMSLQDFNMVFTGYIEHDYPIVARAVTNLSFEQDLSRDVTAFFEVRQYGETCMVGSSSGRLFENEEGYKRTRSKTLDLHHRQAAQLAETVRASRTANR